MTPPLRFKFSTHSSSPLTVTSLVGDEALSRPFRFEVELCSTEPALPFDAIIGRAATLHIGGRCIEGVVAELEQGGACSGGYRYRAVLVPRLWLLSLATKSRIYRDLSLPQIATVVAAEAGIDVQLRLTRAYAVERFVVQYRESDLAFLSRLLEAEGIAYHLRGQVLILSDDNSAFDDRTDASVEAFSCSRRMTPRSLLLHDVDATAVEQDRAGPVEALATIDESGFGTQIEDGVPLLSPEHGQQMAARRAEAMRVQATRYQGRSAHALAAGQRFELVDHYRDDFNREYIVVTARHEACEGGATYFEAVSADTVFRPAISTPKPRIHGVMPAVVDAGVDERGRYSVALPFDLGGNPGHGSQPLPLLSPDEGARFTLRSGVPVVLDFVDGDPSRPLIAGAVPRGRRASAHTNQIRTPQGAIIEMSGSYAMAPQGDPRAIDGALAELRPLNGPAPLPVTATGSDTQVALSWTAVAGATQYEVYNSPVAASATPIWTGTALNHDVTGLTNGTTYTYAVRACAGNTTLAEGTAAGTPIHYAEESTGIADWIRFAVPHGDGKWSYLRYGENTETTVSSYDETAGTFAEKTNVEGAFTSKYFDEDGEPDSDAGDRKTFNWSDLNSSDYNANHSDREDSKGSKSYFDHASSSGIFDYTDGNRTTITRGDHQSVTEGHRTDVILGDYRLVIPCRTNGIYDADTYWMRFRKSAGSWRKTERSHVSSDSITWGDTESLYMGFALNGTCGTAVDVTFGTVGDAFVGYKLELGAGITFKYDLGHSFEYSTGKNYSNATKHEVEAKERITMRIPGAVERTTQQKEQIAFAAAMTVVSAGLIAGTTAAFAAAEPMGDAKWPVGLGLSAASMLAFGTALTSFYLIKDRKVLDDEPSLEMTSEYIKLSIGTSVVSLDKDGVVLSFGDDTIIDLSDEGVSIWAKDTIVEEGDFTVLQGDFDVCQGVGAIKSKAIQVK